MDFIFFHGGRSTKRYLCRHFTFWYCVCFGGFFFGFLVSEPGHQNEKKKVLRTPDIL